MVRPTCRPKRRNAPTAPRPLRRLGGEVNVPVVEDMYENIKRVGLPQWSEADQTLAKGLQRELKVPERGLAAKIPELRRPKSAAELEALALERTSRPGADPTTSET
jgi:hypothetical protein